MIYCKIEELENYRNISKNIDTAITYVLSHDLSKLPFGKTVVDDDNVYINKSLIETKSQKKLPFELHKKYIDLHIDLTGDEKITYATKKVKLLKEYDDNDDYELYESDDSTELSMSEDYCLFFFPEELHKPGIKSSTKKTTKCVVKILKK